MSAEITLIEWFDDHFYKVTEDEKTYYIPSVTTKLGIIRKEGLERWRGDVTNREADLRLYDAQQRGKRIHWAWETVQLGGVVIYDPWQGPQFSAEQVGELKKQHGAVATLRTQDEMAQLHKLQRMFKVLKPQIIAVEKKVYDLENKDAGTIDGVYWIDGGEYLIAGKKPLVLETGIYIADLKSGNFMDDNVWLQIAPYAKMFESMVEWQVAGGLVFHTGAKTKSGIEGLNTLFRPRKDLLERDYGHYRHAAALWERDHEDDQPKQYAFPNIITLKEGV